MKKGIIAVSLLACTLMPEMVGAGQLTTDFSVRISIGDTFINEAVPTPQGMKMTLPSNLSNWNCTVTPSFFSKDGKTVYHNVACLDITSSLVVGMSVSCHTQTTGSDSNSFFIRYDESNVGFVGVCNTHQVESVPDPFTKTPGTTL